MRLTAEASGPLHGSVAVPGDKSLSHRALLLGALGVGTSQVQGLLTGVDVLATEAALMACGVEIEREGHDLVVHGVGTGGLAEPQNVLDLGNAGTGARLLMGVLAGHPFTSVVTGDASLRRRPMARVLDPLSTMGAQFFTRTGGRLPATVVGTAEPQPIEHRSTIASAQVKSAILLCGLHGIGETAVVEPAASRDHTENMLSAMGARIERTVLADGSHRVALQGESELHPLAFRIPGDPSSAAFPIVATLICPGSNARFTHVGTNPLRTGLFETLKEMGADLKFEETGRAAGEPVCTIEVSAGPLKGVEVPAERAPSMIDEFPILAMAAAFADGQTVMRGLGELRVKESDRFAAVLDGLKRNGVDVEADGDDLMVTGSGGKRVRGGARLDANHDHRIAMSFLVLGLGAEDAISVDGSETIETSFPGFVELMRGLGARIG